MVSGNNVHNTVVWDIPDPGYSPTTGNAIGIYCETNALVSGNIVDSSAKFGIIAGHNVFSSNLNINSNLILNTPIGIGYGNQSGAGQLEISGNQIQGATSGAIVSVTYNDLTGSVARTTGSSDYGNQYDAQEMTVFVGNNRSY